MLEVNIINSEQYLSNILIDFVITLISFIASIVTIIVAMNGVISSGILVKLKNWQDRKAVRYSILNPINKLEVNKVKPIILAIEALLAIIPIMIILVLACIGQYWLDYNRFTSDTYVYWLIFLSMYTCKFCDVLYKSKHKDKFCCIPFTVIFVILLDVIVLKESVEYCYPYNIKKFPVLLIVICVCNFILIELIINWIRNNIKYKLKRSKKIEIFKIILGSVYIGVVIYCIMIKELMIVEDIVNIMFLFGWMISCYIEVIIINNIKVDFRINKLSGFEITQKAIYQYEYDKVKYILTNGCTKIVDSDEIQSIDYTIENIMGRSNKNNVTCLLKNNDILNFDGYKFIKDLWISFYKYNRYKKDVKIVNSKRVKKIIVEEKKQNKCIS